MKTFAEDTPSKDELAALPWTDLPARLLADGAATAAAVGLERDAWGRVEELHLEVVATGTVTQGPADQGPADQGPAEQGNGEIYFDLASLTKPFVATLALVLDATGELPLTTPVGALWPHAHRQLRKQPLESLLRHTSGLKAWTPLYADSFLLDEVVSSTGGNSVGPTQASATSLSPATGLTAAAVAGSLGDRRQWGAKPGTYSDLGYLLYGLACREALGAELHLVLTTRVLEPLLAAHGALPDAITAAPPPRRVAPCRLDTTREVELAAGLGLELESLGPPEPGVPQDGNARYLTPALGPVAGHAGLFGTVSGVLALAREWRRPGALLTEEAVCRALTGEHRLGWFRPRAGNSGGSDLGPEAFGHTGFTGGSLWVEPSTSETRPGAAAVLLAHRPTPAWDLHPYRHALHRQLVDALAAPAPPRSAS